MIMRNDYYWALLFMGAITTGFGIMSESHSYWTFGMGMLSLLFIMQILQIAEKEVKAK